MYEVSFEEMTRVFPLWRDPMAFSIAEEKLKDNSEHLMARSFNSSLGNDSENEDGISICSDEN